MKIMHLGDLHLGKIIFEQSLIEDQKYILKEIINIIKEEQVDIIMISGDIYDRTIPTIEAVNLLDDFLTSIIKMKKNILIISGNHDSNDRLHFASSILKESNLYIETDFTGKLNCVTLKDEYGDINFYMLPFVKPSNVRKHYPDVTIESYNDAIKTIIDNTKIDKNKRNIIMVHQFVMPSNNKIELSESETTSLGGIDNVDASIFKDFDYVALGHIHKPQRLSDNMRYCGSPLKYSFSEINYNKTVPILDYNKSLNISLHPLKPLRDFKEIKGTLEELCDKNNKCDDYIRAIITDEEQIYDPIGKLRKIYPNVLKLEISNRRIALSENSKISPKGNIKERTPLDLFNEFYHNQNNVTLSKEEIDELEKVIKEVLDETN